MDAEVAINGEDLSSLSGGEEEEEEGMEIWAVKVTSKGKTRPISA